MKPPPNGTRFFLTFNHGLARMLFTSGLLFLALSASARPRDPWPPLPEFSRVLLHESFDAMYARGVTNAQWVIPNYGTLVESWSGYALERLGVVTPYVVPGLDSAGRTNIAPEGALRFWVRPYWSSAPEGRGPGTEATFLEMAVVDTKQAVGVWWLEVNAEGTVVTLFAQGEAGPMKLLATEIRWQAGEWHQLVLNYAAKGTALYVDGELTATGLGTLKLPPKAAALAWGSGLSGADSIGGELEELFVFARALEVGFGYHTFKQQAALGPITTEEDQALAELRAKRKAEREAREEAGGDPPQMLRLVGSTAECIMNVPVYITNTVSSFDTNDGWTVMFDIQGSWDGTTTALYDVFTTTNLIGDSITNSQWIWLERGPSCSTYQYTNQPTEIAFYVLGTPLDSDEDGLTDAYERLVSKTNPALWDTDGDGLSDGWEVAHGMNPLVDESAQTAGRINYQYDGSGWLRVVSGAWSEGITLDDEGNIQQLP